MVGDKDRFRFSFFRRLRGLKVKDIMATTVLVVRENRNVRDLTEKMIREKSRGYPVVDKNGKLVGFITDRDILMKVVLKDIKLSDIYVKDIMSTEVRSLHPNDSIEKLTDSILRYKITKLPVLDDQGKLVGIVTYKDVLRTTPRYLKILRDEFVKPTEESISIGKCENCGVYETLIYKENLFICENCTKIAKKNRLST